MASCGTNIGNIYDIVIDVGSGELKQIVVDPSKNIDISLYENENSLLYISFDAVTAMKDCIIIDNNRAMIQ